MVEKNKIAKGFAWTSITQCANVLFKFLSLIILSRILAPKEYGLLSIIMIFIEVGYMICDSGMGGSLVKKEECRHIDYDTLFVYNIVVCVCIYAILWFSAPFIADIYNEDVLTPLIRVASLLIIIQTLYVPQYIHILKNLDFKSIAIATIVASAGGLGIAVAMAYNGWRVWSLIGQFIAESLFFLFYYGIKTRYIPRLHFSKESFREQFSFGINLLGANLLNTISNNIYNNVVAKVVNLRSAGYFVQAIRIQNLPVSVTNGVIDRALFPILSKCNDPKEFEAIYFRVYGIILMSICFLTAFISVFSTDLVTCFLGDQWYEAASILSVLSISIVPLTIQTICRNALKSQGKTFAILKNQVVKTIILIGALLLASIFGFWYIVVGIVLAHFIVALSILKMTSGLVALTLSRHFSILLPFVLWCIISTAIPFALSWLLPDFNVFVRVVLCLLLSAAIYFTGLCVSKNSSFIYIFDLFVKKLKR